MYVHFMEPDSSYPPAENTIPQLPKTPGLEVKNRIHILKQKMDQQNIKAVLLTHKPDIFYFSGTAQDCYLYIHIDHEPILFVNPSFRKSMNKLDF